uniref:Secreted protein n=1 Tax=Heterorhabditis bacteriophora TaxID=37862 RepID=A0A1I7XEZ5_HETBA
MVTMILNYVTICVRLEYLIYLVSSTSPFCEWIHVPVIISASVSGFAVPKNTTSEYPERKSAAEKTPWQQNIKLKGLRISKPDKGTTRAMRFM